MLHCTALESVNLSKHCGNAQRLYCQATNEVFYDGENGGEKQLPDYVKSLKLYYRIVSSGVRCCI